MKSFRPYLSRGRVPTAASWIAAFSGVAAVVIGYAIMLIWVSEVPLRLRRPAAWGFVVLGLVTAYVVGCALRRRGMPLSRKED